MEFVINRIKAAATYPLRHKMLRPESTLESCFFEGDESPKTMHWGAFLVKTLVGVLSSYVRKCTDCEGLSFQLRGMAVLPEVQHKGIATILLHEAETYLKNVEKATCLWLNARTGVQELYFGTGFSPVGAVFEIPEVGLHQRFVKKLL